jgi:signal transduction histidine kinase
MQRGRRGASDVPAVPALTWAAVGAFVLGVYAAVVVGGGALLGLEPSEPHLLLSVLATSIVAVALEPVEVRARRWARRRVQGERATPYEALTTFAARTADTYALDEVAPRMAHMLAAATGAASAEVWVSVANDLQLTACWPPTAEPGTRVGLGGETLMTAEPPAELVVPVHHGGALLGALVVRRDDSESTSPVEQALVADLAAQAGLVLHNLALTAELGRRVAQIAARSEELTASRARLATAQVSERRRLERDIHDGAQQHLVALAVQLRLAQTLLGRAPDDAARLLGDLAGAVDRAEATVRDLAHGVYPRTLVNRGLVAALHEATAGSPLLIRLRGTDLRWPEEVEAAAYFGCMEAVQNAVKHARATVVDVEIGGDHQELRFAVRDDGIGFPSAADGRGSGLQNMADRMETLGGTLRVRSTPGAGTVVEGRLPVRVPATAGAS